MAAMSCCLAYSPFLQAAATDSFLLKQRLKLQEAAARCLPSHSTLQGNLGYAHKVKDDVCKVQPSSAVQVRSTTSR